ncbi:MAG: hypothetical protein H0T97_07735, partial [Actinobacteria bacterium]|nr:hypothetical protein [Actinomycetota bacterium]
MSELAISDGEGTIVGADQLTRDARDSIRVAREARKALEPVWKSNLAFASGKFWLEWDRDFRRLSMPPELQNKELYSTDVITEYRMTVLGELGSDDDRPELLLRRDDQPSEDFQAQLNRAVGWGWDYEWRGDEALSEMRRLCIDLGTAAIRVRFDPTVGPVVGELPHVNGAPVYDREEQTKLADQFAGGVMPGVEMKPVQQGSIRWEALSPFNLLVPPGVPNERDFPWECVVRPALLSSVKREYGDVAAELKEDTDIGSVIGLEASGDSSGGSERDGKVTRVHGHVWLFTFYERPCPDYPEGRTITFAGNKLKALKIEEKLPVQGPDGSYRSGVAYFHWWRVTGRFWSRAFVEAMKDPQRSVNKRRTQINEIIDRGLPAILVQKNSAAKERSGHAIELIEIGESERPPVLFNGINPGEWMYHDIQEMRGDIEHATGVRGPRLGENPMNVTTYAQLALLNENDQVKRQEILREHKRGIAACVENSVYGIRTYWGRERQISLVGEEDSVDASIFDATRVPTFFIVKVAKGAVKPRSQGAELKKIEDIWGAALASGAVMSGPLDWVEWLKDSQEQGMALDLPEGGVNEHEDKAELENHLMIEGRDLPVQYYDPA